MGTKQHLSAGAGGLGFLSCLVLHTRVGHRHSQVTATEQLQGGSDTTFPTALMFVITAGNHRKPFPYLCLCISLLSWPTEISCDGSLALLKRCGFISGPKFTLELTTPLLVLYLFMI